MLRVALLLASLPVWQQVLAAGTSFLNHTELLSGVENPDWYEQNIPLIDIPSPQIQDVYYYRWQTYKEHLAYTGAQHGYLATEFLHPASYGAPFGGIVAAAGHHIVEGRWVRDLGYGRDLVNYWLAGPGQLPKPATEELNKDTHDWAHEYSFWAASAVWKRYLVTGDRNFTAGQLGNLVRQYRGWDSHFSPDLGLYWQVPVWDATEYTAASYESPGGDPYHGGAGFRPTINAYQYGDARAIAAIAALVGDAEEDLQAEYEQRAASLRQALQTHLWNEDKKFFMHRDRDFGRKLLQDREIMGFLPWMFAMPPGNFSTEPFAQLTDARGFLSTFGPTTLEQRSKWYMHEADGCCRWDGPSWPFATSQTLTAVETLLHEYHRQSTITPSDYVAMLETYAKTLYKGGKPYVAEAHHPAEDRWIYDGRDHSEDYNHSTFVDNVLAGLLGLRGQAGDTLVVRPLVPPSWAYFAVENVAYHGRSVTVLWDESGTRYGQGKGFSVFVDGALSAHRDTVEELTIRVTPAIPRAPTLKVNIAANTQNDARLSRAFASYTSGFDDPMRAIDGNVWRTAVPSNSRWTSYDSPNATDYFGVDLRRTQSLCDVRLYFYDDGGGVRIPDRYDLQYYRNDDDGGGGGNSSGTWETVPGQQRSKAATPGSSNEEIRVTFPALAASQLRVVAPNPGGSAGQGWGLSELEVWTAALFHLRGEHSGKLMGVERMLGTPGARVQQYDDNGTRDHHWRFAPAAGGWSTVENLNSGLVLAVASRGDDGANNNTNLVQDDYDYDDNGEGPAPRQLWKVQAQGSGRFLLRNKGSGLVAGIEANSTSNSANVVLREDDGAESNLWSVLPAAIEGC
ncbi:hypothetical protein V2A60_003630 [Cordyceps javanica]|uniref:Coagulation factor 5/8 type domain-containing protein n=1 Tax=Cordyceps javanica TaxID=43265 RepID=A0A545VTB0_9HYPO|nr:coagulation factor 5/8 type domain-containing protein [Cordyceps javanica]TQW04953.1 coagulation factor 5/8 type domain protein [Cordyceps javanica]